jgi:hypothetical protein
MKYAWAWQHTPVCAEQWLVERLPEKDLLDE